MSVAETLERFVVAPSCVVHRDENMVSIVRALPEIIALVRAAEVTHYNDNNGFVLECAICHSLAALAKALNTGAEGPPALERTK